MKRILFIFAVLAVSSCSKTLANYENADEISLSPFNRNVTKSMMAGADFEGEAFKVWAWYNAEGAQANAIGKWQTGFVSGATELYINEKKFVEKDAAENKWGGEISYYWPNTGSLVFAGYHAPNLTEDQVTYDFSASTNKMTFKDVERTEVSAAGYAEDIMYFNMTPSSFNQASSTVGLDFKHALSWITVTLAKRVDPVIDATIRINSVTFKDIASKGTGTVENQAPISWDVASSARADFYLPDLPLVLEYDTEVTASGTTYKTRIYNLKEHLFIPQDITGVLSVNYTVISNDAVNEEDKSKFTETYNVDLGSLKTNAHTAWEPGKHYTYNLSIGTDEILVTPVVSPWNPSEIDVLIPLPEEMYP